MDVEFSRPISDSHNFLPAFSLDDVHDMFTFYVDKVKFKDSCVSGNLKMSGRYSPGSDFYEVENEIHNPKDGKTHTFYVELQPWYITHGDIDTGEDTLTGVLATNCRYE